MGDGALTTGVAATSLAALALSIAGMILGQWIRLRIEPPAFRVCFFVGLLLLAAHLAARPVL